MFTSPLAMGLLATAVVCAGAAFDRRRRRERNRLARPEIQRWEDEGGAIPKESGTPAETTAVPLTPQTTA
jgi:hypothetical protein